MSRFAIFLLVAACAPGTIGGVPGPIPNPGEVSVDLAPRSTTLSQAASQQFAATVTNSANNEVVWSIDESGGGTISASGLYLAPNVAGTFHVRAAAQVDPSKFALATVTVRAVTTVPPTPAVTVAPKQTMVTVSETAQLGATVSGLTDISVSWSVQEGNAGGSVSATGLYTAPASPGVFHVVATSNAQPDLHDTATVTVRAQAGTPPVLTAGEWTNVGPPPSLVKFGGDPYVFTQGMAIDPNDPSTIYLGVCSFDPQADNAGLYKTTDRGTTWKRVGQLDEPIRVRVDPNDSQHLFAADGVRGATLGVWESHDGGETWEKPASLAALAAANHNFYIDDVYNIAVDPADFKHMLVTFHQAWGLARTDYWNGGSGILETKDGAKTWVVHNPGPGWGTGHNAFFIDSNTWLLGTQGSVGYLRTANSGATWTQSTPENMAHGGGQIYRTASGAIFATAWNEVLRSTDNGVSFSKVGTIKYTTGLIGDGVHLYAHPVYADTPFYTALEADPTNWSAYNGGKQVVDDGSFEMAYDSVNGIVYSATWSAGLLALKVRP